MKNLKSKIDAYLWAFMWVLPVFVFFVSYYRSGGAPEFFLWFEREGMVFPFVKDVLDNVWQMAFGDYLFLSGYISYLVCIEVVHCLFDAIVFIPRIAHSFIDRAVGYAGGEKK